jgi:hypothetical protein
MSSVPSDFASTADPVAFRLVICEVQGLAVGA